MTPTHLRDTRRTITATEAQAELAIPAATIRSWAARRRLFPVAITHTGERVYSLVDVLALNETRRARPARTEILAAR